MPNSFGFIPGANTLMADGTECHGRKQEATKERNPRQCGLSLQGNKWNVVTRFEDARLTCFAQVAVDSPWDMNEEVPCEEQSEPEDETWNYRYDSMEERGCWERD